MVGAPDSARTNGFTNAVLVVEQLQMKVQFLNVRPLASTWEAEISELTEAAVYEEVKQHLPGRPLEFDLEHGAIYSKCEQVGSFRIVSPEHQAVSSKGKPSRVILFQTRKRPGPGNSSIVINK